MNSILTLGLIGVALIAGVATPDEVNIRKDSAASTGIAVLDTNTDTIHSTVEEQSRHMEALSQVPGFRSAAVGFGLEAGDRPAVSSERDGF